jgi:hypothetical protein
MLFLTYWELNENMAEEERGQVGQKVTSNGLFPPTGVKVVRWDGTPDGWGILLLEADSAADVFRALDVWRASGAGFFKLTKTAPALPVQELMPLAAEISQELAAP